MFSYLKNLIGSLVGVNDTPEDEALDNEQIVNTINSLNLGSAESIDSDNSDENPLGENDAVLIPVTTLELVHRTGKVTYLCEEYGLIDNAIHFAPSKVSSNISIKVNDEVLYTSYKAKENESDRVYKIYALKGELWEYETGPSESDETHPKEKDELCAFVKHVPGRVTKRKGRDVYVEPLNIWCNLDNIETTFIPIEGDWVSVEVAVAFDENISNFMGDIIDAKSIKPLMVKSNMGRITLWSITKNEGAIENSIFFTAYNCDSGYVPSLGDSVVYDAIESDQETFKWRALTVYPYEKKMNKRNESKTCVGSDSPSAYDFFVNKYGIFISPMCQAVNVELHASKIVSFEITNRSSSEKRLLSVCLTCNREVSIVKKPPKDLCIMPNQTVKVHFMCKGKFLGLTGETCLFNFHDYVLARKIEINVLSSKDMDSLLKCKLDNIVNVFKKTLPIKQLQTPDLVLYGPKPWQPPKFVSRERKCVFNIPRKLQSIFSNNMLQGAKRIKALEEYAPYLKFDLNFTHYAARYHTCLYMEEIELRQNIRKYDMNGVFLSRCGEYFSLQVSGLVERRPSLIIGDSIILTQPWSEENKIQHVGFIYNILEKEVLIKFHNWFHDSYDESECNIEFVPNTFFFSRCHEAIKRAESVLGERWLFPTQVDEKPPQIDFNLIDFVEEDQTVEINHSLAPLECAMMDVSQPENCQNTINTEKHAVFEWVNKNLNIRQKLAVLNVLKGQGRPLPYIIFGPPGTGKTVTLVEIIIQIYRLIPSSRILITTPSNSAADLICHRLIHEINIKPGDLVRLAAITRIREGLVPEDLRPYTTFYRNTETRTSNENENENIKACVFNELTGMHKITVSTCSNIGKLHFSGFSNGHFTHILVDEAGQTIEPEVLIAATFLNPRNGQLVLAGDPQQLGPVVCSQIAKHYGLGESLLQRFTNSFPYCRDVKSFPETSGFDPRFITKLNVNYRTVPEILSLPSQMFYHSDLIPTVSQTEGEEARIIEKFNFMGDGRDKPAALIFHGIIGNNYQEPDSPSWFNPHEVWQVVLYLKKLYSIGLKAADIGIVTPYMKQSRKLSNLLCKLNLAMPKIGTTEEYQGQEKNVIILSTVRSSVQFLGVDIAHHLGFVACPKRLNVSLTRAKALLIIVGNPVLLSKDPYWVTVIRYCMQNGSYTGCNFNYFEDPVKFGLDFVNEEKRAGVEGECPFVKQI